MIGASTSPEKLGYGAARNLVQSGYRGAIHFMAQKSGELFGRRVYTSLQEVPDPVDLAILIVPPNAAPGLIEDCGRRGIKAAAIISSGFREVGKEGAALEDQCVKIAREYGVRLLGPNCIGVIDTRFPLDTTFLQPPMPAKGGIGFISHSGAFAAAIVDSARGQGFGFSRIVSLGNQADVTETDMLSIFADDPHTKVIALYMEGVSDGRRFIQVAGKVAQQKPVVALKAGRFEAGQKAAASHTGALAASDIAFDAAFEKAAILRADTAEQMFDWARALERWADSFEARRSQRHDPSAQLNRIAILTNAGGPGVIAADSLEREGLILARLSESTRKELSVILPSAASVHNPVDMLASASPETYASCLKILLRDENVDSVIVIIPPPPMFRAEEAARAVIEAVKAHAEKPVAIVLMGSTLVEKASDEFRNAGIPTYPFPERAASALGALARRVNRAQSLQSFEQDQNAKVRSLPTPIHPDELLASYGIPTAPMRLARDENEAAAIAGEMGFPLVLKIASPDILHKSDVGGVILNVENEKSLRLGYAQIMERVTNLTPPPRIEGVHIQQQIPQGQEVIVGMTRDPQFGPLMMFGSGGVEVEGLRDVAFALAPLNQAEAESMMRKTWAARKLKGFRNIPPVDEEAVRDVLVKLSHLAAQHEEIVEIEINPLRALAKGAVAVDVRMKTVAPH